LISRFQRPRRTACLKKIGYGTGKSKAGPYDVLEANMKNICGYKANSELEGVYLCRALLG